MSTKARRLLPRFLHALMRRGLLALCALPGPLTAEVAILSARYDGPTARYTHGVLGDTIEYETLVIALSDGSKKRVTLSKDLVFEDTTPRVIDLDFDGLPEIIVVESSQTEGARLSVYDSEGRITSTDFIGTRFRWLAPVGAADFDRDGHMEIGYVDRPHLAKTLRVLRYQDRTLTKVGSLVGVTNHRIGEPDIAGGVRTCGQKPEMLLASANWSQMISVTLADELTARIIGNDTSRAAFARALRCDL